MLLVLGKNSPALLVLYGDAQGKAWNLGRWPRLTGWQLLQNAFYSRALHHVANRHLGRISTPRPYGPSGLWPLRCCFLKFVRWLGESFFYQENLLGDAATLLPTLAVSLARRLASFGEHHETA